MDLMLTDREWKQVQAFLLLGGHTAGGKLIADGVPGQKTLIALGEFQEEQGLKVTGILDKPILDRLKGGSAQLPDGLLPKSQAVLSLSMASWKLIQALLILGGYDPQGALIADGVQGMMTTKALREFQWDHNIPNPDGFLTPETAAELMAQDVVLFEGETDEPKKLGGEPSDDDDEARERFDHDEHS